MKILVINPGSTSTKWAVYDDGNLTWKKTRQHTVEELEPYTHVIDQLAMRTQLTRDALRDSGIPLEFDAIIGRGGLLKPTPSGVYEVTDTVARDLREAENEHACNLGGLIARELADEAGCQALIADPEVVDEMIDEARLSGLPDLPRRSIFHALNTKAVARRYAQSIGRPYEDLNLILVHLGGGISVGAHRRGKVIDVNNALNGDGPFSPERAGTLPSDQLTELCFSGRYTKQQIKQMINGRGGLSAHLGTNDVRRIADRAEKGEEPYKSVLDSMLYGVGREIGARAVALRGEVDAIILTGGIANSRYCTDRIASWTDWIAPIVVRAGEDELDSLAFNAQSYLQGDMNLSEYRG